MNLSPRVNTVNKRVSRALPSKARPEPSGAGPYGRVSAPGLPVLPFEHALASFGLWLEQTPGSTLTVFQGRSASGKQVEVYILPSGLYQCFWDNGEHWFNLPLEAMRDLVLTSLKRDAYPHVIGY